MSFEAVCNPRVISRQETNISLNWENVFPSIEDKSYLAIGVKKRIPPVIKPSQERIYELCIQDNSKEWRLVYWGRRTDTVVTNLKPSTIYLFRIKLIQENFHSHWLEFRAATNVNQYHVARLARAINCGKSSMVRKLITCRPYLLECLSNDDKTPLMQATECGNLDLVQVLCTMGANVNAQSSVSQRTALMLALFYGFVKIARVLLNENALMHMRDVNDRTALHYAVDGDCLEAVKFALEYGAEINARDDKGWTPLLRAVTLEVQDDVIKQLMRTESDYGAVDERGLDFRKHLELTNRTYLLKRL